VFGFDNSPVGCWLGGIGGLSGMWTIFHMSIMLFFIFLLGLYEIIINNKAEREEKRFLSFFQGL
jgi:hypothetical protein